MCFPHISVWGSNFYWWASRSSSSSSSYFLSPSSLLLNLTKLNLTQLNLTKLSLTQLNLTKLSLTSSVLQSSVLRSSAEMSKPPEICDSRRVSVLQSAQVSWSIWFTVCLSVSKCSKIDTRFAQTLCVLSSWKPGKICDADNLFRFRGLQTRQKTWFVPLVVRWIVQNRSNTCFD